MPALAAAESERLLSRPRTRSSILRERDQVFTLSNGDVMLDADFLNVAVRSFNPYRPSSGTEHVAFLLYGLVRMTRPRVVVEYGCGHTTLFLLRALADNVRDFREEREALLEKSARLVERLPESPRLDEDRSWMRAEDGPGAAMKEWMYAGDKASSADPDFYREEYSPHLYGLDKLDRSHPYIQELEGVIGQLGHADLFTHVSAPAPAAALPPRARPVDFAWNDDDDYRGFFREFWPHLNPSGGLFVFHNVPAVKSWFDAVEWMKAERAHAGDLEVLLLEEPHKFNQNGCAILRKVTTYRPRFVAASPSRLWQGSAALIGRTRQT